MKKFISLFVLLVSLSSGIQAQTLYEFKIITTVESIVPMGIGRSRIVDANEEKDYKEATTTRNTENKFKNNKTNRKELKVNDFDETKLLNFYSMVGINFQNIASNDAMIASKLEAMNADGWELYMVTSAVESDAGKQDGHGIFITRYIFRRPKQ